MFPLQYYMMYNNIIINVIKLSDSVSASDEVDALADKPGDGMEPREQPSLTGELKTADDCSQLAGKLQGLEINESTL